MKVMVLIMLLVLINYVICQDKEIIKKKSVFIRYKDKTREVTSKHSYKCIPDTFHRQPERLSLETPKGEAIVWTLWKHREGDSKKFPRLKRS